MLRPGTETFVTKTADQTLIGTSYADVTELGVYLEAKGVYEFEFNVWADADVTTTGIDIAVNGPTSPDSIYYLQEYPRAATTMTYRFSSAYDFNTANTSSAGTTRALYRVSGVIRVGTTPGTLIPRIKREAVGTGPNARAGSWGRVRRLM